MAEEKKEQHSAEETKEKKVTEAEKKDPAPEEEKTGAEKTSDSSEKKEEKKADASGDSGKDEKESKKNSSREKASDESSEKDEKDSGKSFFKKKEKKDPRDQKIADLTDRVTRQMAEFDNFRKRTEKEKSEMFASGQKDIIEKILPVVDNFERALAAKPEEGKEDDAFRQGMEMIYKGLLKTLDDLGVKEIEAEGKEFDPAFHNAVMHEDNDKFGENVVSKVLQKGYTFHDTVIRHAMVQVAN